MKIHRIIHFLSLSKLEFRKTQQHLWKTVHGHDSWSKDHQNCCTHIQIYCWGSHVRIPRHLLTHAMKSRRHERVKKMLRYLKHIGQAVKIFSDDIIFSVDSILNRCNDRYNVKSPFEGNPYGSDWSTLPTELRIRVLIIPSRSRGKSGATRLSCSSWSVMMPSGGS